MLEQRAKVIFSYQSLQETYRLAERYIQTQAFPGRAIKLLEDSVAYAQNRYITPASVQRCVESTAGVKLEQAGVDESMKLLNLEQLLHQRCGGHGLAWPIQTGRWEAFFFLAPPE